MPYDIRGIHQITRSRITAADAPALWDILSDSRLLPEWVPAVRHVDWCESRGEAFGAVRHCSVELAGRSGQIVEECVDIVPRTSITYAVRSDTLGMVQMFRDYCFRISLQATGSNTTVVIDTYYTPRNLLFAILNVVIMRRRFRSVVDGILQGLCLLAERRTQGEATITAPAHT